MDNGSGKCFYCSVAGSPSRNDIWIGCDVCNTWYHTECLGLSERKCDQIERYHCPRCMDKHGSSIYKANLRRSKRERVRLDYADLNDGKTADQDIWSKILGTKTFAKDVFKRYHGSEVTRELLAKTGMREPFLIEYADGLDMQMPSHTLTINDIADAIGHEHPVEVIDVATQSEVPNWTIGRWAAYYSSPEKDRIRNVISLEISDTKFAENIVRPKIVREIDWIDHIWPEHLKPMEYPKVQLYCLMGTKGSYTDFHIDFGGSSVFYHIIKGSKVFYFIEPTALNLRKYQRWSSSPDQSLIFFADEVKKCYAVHLRQGNTLIIPTGWIHAVYTPEDALVIGGNFLHSMNIGTQLQIHDIEVATKVPTKFRFPFYKRMNWYAALHYRNLFMQDRQSGILSEYELNGLASLAKWLQNDIRQCQSEKLRKDIPHCIDDPTGLISQLQSDVEAELLKRRTSNTIKGEAGSSNQTIGREVEYCRFSSNDNNACVGDSSADDEASQDDTTQKSVELKRHARSPLRGLQKKDDQQNCLTSTAQDPENIFHYDLGRASSIKRRKTAQ